jgi:hypothetical protein
MWMWSESIWTTYLYSIYNFYNLATRTPTTALEDPRGSAINGTKELTYLQRVSIAYLEKHCSRMYAVRGVERK